MKRSLFALCCVVGAVWTTSSWAVPAVEKTEKPRLASSATVFHADVHTYIDANRLLMFVINDGRFAFDVEADTSRYGGLHYPAGSGKTAMYAAGLWLGAMADSDLRITPAEYSTSFSPGPLASPAILPSFDEHRVFKIIRGLKESGFYDGPRPSGDPAAERLWDDYHQWPIHLGAPTDGGSQPAFYGDQTLWCVYNDADPEGRDTWYATELGLGVEVQQTTFAYDRDDAFGDCAFIRYVIINKGGENLHHMYVTYWADPDLGQPSDDFGGSDSVLNLGYAYNATNTDNVYGSEPPAPGFWIGQGPIIPAPGDSAVFMGAWRDDFRNLPMTSYIRLESYNHFSSAQEVYWFMQGLWGNGMGAPFPIIDPTTNAVTTYMFSGDPITETGWVDCCPQVSCWEIREVNCFEVAGPAGVPVDPAVDVACQHNSTNEWFITTAPECDFSRMNWRQQIGDDSWEIRFTATGSEYYDFGSDEKYPHRVPFEVWNIGTNTPDDPSDDVRLQITVLEYDTTYGWSLGDRIYAVEREYYEPLPDIAEYTWDDDFRIGRIIFNENIPQEGTVVRFTADPVETICDTTSSKADLSFLQSSGPFNLAPGDTQHVLMAVMLGAGPDRLASVANLKAIPPTIQALLGPDLEICDCRHASDFNDDGTVNLVDLAYMINYALLGGPHPPADADCPLINRADFNCDDTINLVDIVGMVNYIFRQPAPGPCDPCMR